MNHMRVVVLSWLLAAVLGSAAVCAGELGIPVELDYRIVQQELTEHVFDGPGDSREVFADAGRCNWLVLSEPRVSGLDSGQVRVISRLQAQTGTPLGSSCRLAKTWHGLVETLQTAHVGPEGSNVVFRVADSTLLRAEDQQDMFPDFLQSWINDYVHPRLATASVDIEPALQGIREVFDSLVQATPADSRSAEAGALSSLRLSGVSPRADSLVVVLSLQVPDAPPDWKPAKEQPLNPDELREWDAAWQAWDGFATWMIKTMAITAGPELHAALAETLLEARYDLRAALASDIRGRDPVRELFIKTWSRLAPLLEQTQLAVPGSRALPYASFISAGNALQALDLMAPHLGTQLDQHALRSLARVLIPGVSDYELRYDTAVDPELRELLGLDPEFADETPAVSWLDWLIPSAYASLIPPELVKQLSGWVPARKDVDRYLLTVEKLLGAIAREERNKGKVPAEFDDVYDALLRATAWQESCWRQYVQHQGEVQTIRSSAGSVGLMQINTHVWRGIYDLDQIFSNVAYNARAGNEILVHYLVDYAIRKNEHEVTDPPDALARATYAMYNGGPGQLSRYRKPGVSSRARAVDNAFWQKYQDIQKEGAVAVRQCLAG